MPKSEMPNSSQFRTPLFRTRSVTFALVFLAITVRLLTRRYIGEYDPDLGNLFFFFIFYLAEKCCILKRNETKQYGREARKLQSTSKNGHKTEISNIMHVKVCIAPYN